MHDDGLAGFVSWLNQGKDVLGKHVIHLERECDEGVTVEVAMQYHDGYDENVHRFANNIRNRDGGTIHRVSIGPDAGVKYLRQR